MNCVKDLLPWLGKVGMGIGPFYIIGTHLSPPSQGRKIINNKIIMDNSGIAGRVHEIADVFVYK